MRTIIHTKPGDANFHLFENFPKEIYPAENVRFSMPEIINHEFLVSGFVLSEHGKVKARVALYDNPHLICKHKRTFCVGNYEAVNDRDVSSELLQHISQYAKQLGAEYIIGPMNGSTWDSYRFSLHHEHPEFFLEPHHHLYYNGQFVAAGFEIIARYFSSIDKQLYYDKPAVLERTNELKELGVTFRNVNPDYFEQELEQLYNFNATAFSTNFLYTPISKKAFIEKYAGTKRIINPEFVMLAEDRNGALLGYFFCLDDLFNQSEKSLIIKTIARHPDEKWRGLGHVIGNMIYRKAVENNYTSVIHAFMFEQGTSTTISKNFSGTAFKNYALYGKEIR